MIGTAMAIGFLTIFLSLYTGVLERTREIGILKALRALRSYVVRLILRESELLAVLGVVTGIAIASGLWRILYNYPTLSMQMTWQRALYAALIVLISSWLGAINPAFRAAG
ncbi:MAG: ABC transporter permease [Terriglobales bacterium]